MTLAYWNGNYLPLTEVTVSPLDRGFLFGDSIYDVLPLYHKKLFRFASHLKRLQHSLDAIKIRLAYSETQWREIFAPLIAAQAALHFNIYLQITRGAEAQRSHQYATNIKPSILAFCTPHPDYEIADFHPVKVVTHTDIRWYRCDIKTTSLLGNILLQQYATEHHAQETILLRGDKVCEATSSNVFIVKNGVLITPPASPLLLSGITRELILEIAALRKLPCQEREITLTELYQADEVWLTGSNKEIQPVVQVDQHQIGDGQIGPVWQNMIRWFFEYKMLK